MTGSRVVGSRFKAKRSNKIERLVGRDQELDELLALWERAKLGEGQVAFICGEPGIGKSQLCQSFIEHIAQERHAILRYQCSPHHLNSPFYPVICQLEHAMGFEQTDTPELNLEKLQATLTQVADATQYELCLYASLLSIPTPRHDLQLSSTPQRQRDLTITALIRHLRRLASAWQHPTDFARRTVAVRHRFPQMTFRATDRLIAWHNDMVTPAEKRRKCAVDHIRIERSQ